MDLTDLPQRLFKLHGFILAALVYSVVVVRPLRPGLPRLLASVPVFLVFSLCPLLVKDSAILSSAIALTTTWVANFKLLSYSGGRGALSHPGIRSGLQWGALLLLPFFPAKSGRTPAPTSSRGMLLGLMLKLAVYLGLTAVLVGVELSALARHLIYAVHFWMFVSLCLDAAMPLGRQLLAGIPLQPAMDGPYAATSVREFWGRRYNQIVSATLLETVYKPIVEGRWVHEEVVEAAAGATMNEVSLPPDAVTAVGAGGYAGGGSVAVRAGPPPPLPQKGPGAMATANSSSDDAISGSGGGDCNKPPRRRRLLVLSGLFTSFLVSGAMHEICIWFACGGKLEGSFRMLGFFLLQPIIILTQDWTSTAVTKWVPEQLRSSLAARVVQTGVTLALVLASAEWFWAPVESCGADRRALAEVDSAMKWLLAQAQSSELLAR